MSWRWEAATHHHLLCVCWAGRSPLLGCPWQEGPQAVADALLGHSCSPFIPVCIGRLRGGTGFLSTYSKTLFIPRIHTLFIPSLFIAFCLVSPPIQGIHKAMKGGLASACVLRMLMAPALFWCPSRPVYGGSARPGLVRDWAVDEWQL